MPKPYPEEFRADVVRVARAREDGVTIEQVALGRGQHDPAPQRQPRRACTPPRPGHQLRPLVLGQLDRLRMRRRHTAPQPNKNFRLRTLAGTRQASDRQRESAALRAAEASAEPDPSRRADLDQAVRDATALADVLDARVEQLDEIDRARLHWLAETAVTRAIAERSKVELASRHVDDEPEQRVTAEEWLDARRASDAQEDPHREITETDLDDDAREQGRADLAEPARDEALVETEVPDVRDLAADEPKPVREDSVRVPEADEVSASLDQAQRAMAEARAREAEAQREAAEHRSGELSRWHSDDVAAEQQQAADTHDTAEPDLADGRGDG